MEKKVSNTRDRKANPTADEDTIAVKPATYTVADLANLLQCSVRHIHRLKDQKKIPGQVRCGRIIRYSRKVIDHWIAKN